MSTTHHILTTSLALLAGLASSLPILGSEAILTDDTTANRTVPRAFYHTQPTLGVAASVHGAGKVAYLKFDLSNLPAGTPSAQISKATLRVYCGAIIRPGLIDIAPVMSPWIESVVTGATAPTLGEVELAGTPVTLAAKRHWVSFDVTQLVRDWADGTFDNNGLALVPQFTLGVGGIVASFDSKENAASSHEPVLDIVLVGNGAAGPQGTAGVQGDIGLTGPKGDVGPKGEPGPVGPQGGSGPVGPIGPAGAQGGAGPAGSQGPVGLKGDLGSQGPVGATGVKGDAGPVGLQGQAGPVGPQGPIGNTGAKGDIGAVGPQGVVGPIGPIGPKGDVGSAGPQGIAGPKGDTGLQGAQGIAGPLGPKGDQGDTGDVGARGTAGPAGPPALGGLTPSRLGTLRWYPTNTAYVATSLGGTSQPLSLCFDGNFVWAAESGGNQLSKLRLDGTIVGAYALNGSPQFCVSDGDFIWASRKTANSVTKLNADTGVVAATVAVGTSRLPISERRQPSGPRAFRLATKAPHRRRRPHDRGARPRAAGNSTPTEDRGSDHSSAAHF